MSLLNEARCYSNVFRDQPWSEAFSNDNGSFYGLDAINRFWSGELTLAYPLKQTSAYIEKELSNLDSRSIFITPPDNDPRILAFGWGYSFPSPEILIQTKWPAADQKDQQQLTDALLTFGIEGKLWYLSEVGVLPNYQGKGMGTRIVRDLLNAAPSKYPVVMRTNIDSPMVIIAQKTGFNCILGPGNSFRDPINPKRVLFMKEN